ncbi:MAG: CPBP family intramembrane metalloprotease [Deltaproteobacteria bacterium]|nr:CPBP family intramembrane metalloprotease [Deltaproteobacteria bacterium]MBW2393363.1 CPBP family intramembrane metalloprotease [Deltaproteobacteria bacterium]
MIAATNLSPTGQEEAARLPWISGLLFYVAVGGAAWAWRWAVDGVGPWTLGHADEAMGPFAGGLVGVVAGLALVALSRAWTSATASGTALAEALGELVRGLSVPAVALLALASGLAEEMLFRGALQAQVGWLLASLLFGAAHYLPRPGLRIWALFALLAGGIFGGLFLWTGTLAAPVAAHVTVNGLNLRWLSRA